MYVNIMEQRREHEKSTKQKPVDRDYFIYDG